ncbi:MAG TPA: hypothetical protein VGV62_07645 [Xanthobacteraceae bacterium]|nr:hypothetical protein [Xanthobacteraceae bacterium]
MDRNSAAALAAEQIKPPPDRPDPEVEPEHMQLRPLRRQSAAQELAPGYLWNGATQELIPILPEDHPDYRQNQEIITEAIRRWDQRASK